MKHSRTSLQGSRAVSVFPDLAPVETRARDRASKRPRMGQVIAFRDAQFARARATGQVKSAVLSFTNMNEYGDLLVRYLRARKEVFIDRLHWDLPTVDGMEFDQYDTPLCRWVIIHERGEVLGGVRLVPTQAQCGIYSYMLRDAQRGLLDAMPDDVLFFEAPVETAMWEASRLFISEHVSAKRRSHVQYLLMQQMCGVGRAMGARHVIGIVPSVWSRWLRKLGLYAVPVGPKFSIDGTASQAALFNVAEQML